MSPSTSVVKNEIWGSLSSWRKSGSSKTKPWILIFIRMTAVLRGRGDCAFNAILWVEIVKSGLLLGVFIETGKIVLDKRVAHLHNETQQGGLTSWQVAAYKVKSPFSRSSFLCFWERNFSSFGGHWYVNLSNSSFEVQGLSTKQDVKVEVPLLSDCWNQLKHTVWPSFGSTVLVTSCVSAFLIVIVHAGRLDAFRVCARRAGYQLQKPGQEETLLRKG